MRLSRRWLLAFLGGIGAIRPVSLHAQADEALRVQPPPHLAGNPGARMSALLEVTIFNIDVLTLRVRVDADTSTRLQALAQQGRYTESLADSVASAVLDANELWASQTLHRDVGLGRLIDGMTETAERAAAAGFISDRYASDFEASLPELFDFLREDGAKKGDVIVLHVVGDTVRTKYHSADGALMLDRIGVSPEGRNASVPSFFAPGTRFRKRLVESLLVAPESK